MAPTLLACLLCPLYFVSSTVLTANDPRVLYTGRFVIPDAADKPALFGWSFTQMACSFHGVSIAVDLHGPADGVRMRVMIDGQFTRYFNVPANTRDTYVLAAGLANANHEVRLWKVTEASSVMKFYSFSLPSGGQFNQAPSRLSRKLEFIGDSDTDYGQFYGSEGCVDKSQWVDSVGDSCSKIVNSGTCNSAGNHALNGVDAYGACCGCGGGVIGTISNCSDIAGWVDSDGDNCAVIVTGGMCKEAPDYSVNGVDASQACCGCKEGMFEVFDSTQNWAAQLAFSVGAEMMVEAISGYGVSDSAGGNIQPAVNHILPFDATYPWDHSQWTPDAIVTLIGPNDDSEANSFVSDYLSLLNNCATKYASAAVKPLLIQVCGGSMDGLDPCAKIQAAVEQFNAANSDHPGFGAYFTTITSEHWRTINPGSHPSEYTGSDKHYNSKGAAVLANDIEPGLRQIMGWTGPDPTKSPTTTSVPAFVGAAYFVMHDSCYLCFGLTFFTVLWSQHA